VKIPDSPERGSNTLFILPNRTRDELITFPCLELFFNGPVLSFFYTSHMHHFTSNSLSQYTKRICAIMGAIISIKPKGLILETAEALKKKVANLSLQDLQAAKVLKRQNILHNLLLTNSNELSEDIKAYYYLLKGASSFTKLSLSKCKSSLRPYGNALYASLSSDLLSGISMLIQLGSDGGALRPGLVAELLISPHNVKELCGHIGCNLVGCRGRRIEKCPPSTGQTIEELRILDCHNKGNSNSDINMVILNINGLLHSALTYYLANGSSRAVLLSKTSRYAADPGYICKHLIFDLKTGEPLDYVQYGRFWEACLDKIQWNNIVERNTLKLSRPVTPIDAKTFFITTFCHFKADINQQLRSKSMGSDALRVLDDIMSHHTGNSAAMWDSVYNRGKMNQVINQGGGNILIVAQLGNILTLPFHPSISPTWLKSALGDV